MCRKMLIIFLAVAGISLIGLGAINEARAGGQSIKVNVECKNVLFELISWGKNGDGGFDFNYKLIDGLNYVQNLSYISLGFDGSFTLDPDQVLGAGNSDGWLYGVPLKSYTITPQDIIGDQFKITVSGAEATKGEVFAYTKAGRTIESCIIEGPVLPCPPPDLPIDVTVPPTKQIALNDPQGNIFVYCVDIDQRTGCPADEVIYLCSLGKTEIKYDGNGKQISPLPFDADFVLGSNDPDVDPDGPTTPTMIHAEGQDPSCPFVKASHNPCQWVILSGRAYGPYCW